MCHGRLRPQNVAVGKRAIVKRAGVCISQTGSGTGGGSTNGMGGEGRMSPTSSMMRLYAVALTFGGIGEPPYYVVEELKQKLLNTRAR